MNPKEFFKKVKFMRHAQKEYFHSRSIRSLEAAKKLEKEIDSIIEKEDSNQTEMFS